MDDVLESALGRDVRHGFLYGGCLDTPRLVTYYVLLIIHISTRSVHIAAVTTAPNGNAFAERFVRSIKEECLDRMILFGEASLRQALREYVAHYHTERTHQGVGQ